VTAWRTSRCCGPGVYGLVASDPTVSRTIAALAADAPAALKAINAARSAARRRAWVLAGKDAPDHGTGPLVIDVDATLLTVHLDKEQPKPTFKRGYGFHPLVAFVDHGAAGTGEPLAVVQRPGNPGSKTAADHVSVVKDALRQLPGHRPGTWPGRKGADPHRRRRSHARVRQLADRAAAFVRARVHPARHHP
jgi:Transposase DDE domain group 1